MAQNNETWGNLPNEILNLIVKECGRDCLKVKWMFVNRKWFDFYLFLTYKSISIHFDAADKKVKRIMSSPFKVGSKVKHINFISLAIPLKSTKSFKPNDILSILMKETPNVEEISFSNEDAWCGKAWSYFSEVLLNTNYWKLRILPEINKNNFLFSSNYYLCACHMRLSLNELYLTTGIVGFSDFTCLKKFTALERLVINEKVVNGIDELELLLRHSPKLKEVVVNFADDRFESFQSEFNEQNGFSFYNLKNLKLCNYTPKHNQELLIFITGNFMLDKLHIIGEEKTPWPSAQVEPDIIEIFFDALNIMNEYEITIPVDTQGTVFTKWINSVNNSKQKIHLSIVYVKKNMDVEVTIKGGKSKAAMNLVYEIGYYDDKSFKKGIDFLNDIDDKFSQVEIVNVPHDIGPLLQILIAKEHIRLDKLIITSSVLNTYSPSVTTLFRIQYIKSLKFSKCNCRFTAFKSFMDEFQSLDYVQLDNCSFDRGYATGIVDISNSIIGTINITNFYKRDDQSQNYGIITSQNPAIILVSLSAMNYATYYMIMGDKIVEATEDAFNIFCRKLNQYETPILKIKIKSMKQLLLQPTDDSKKIRIGFPQCQ